MVSDFLFGGTPLVAAHFESDLARAVFNDRGIQAVPGSYRQQIEARTLQWLYKTNAKVIMRWSRQIDLLIVPVLSPSAFRNLCCFLCEQQPQAIGNMPNTRDSVQSLARAVNFSRLINPDALDRICVALVKEGLT